MTVVSRARHDVRINRVGVEMRSLAQWLDLYSVCHQHPVNRRLHHICVPAIQFSLLGLLWLVRLPVPETWPHAVANLASLVVVLVMMYYLALDWRIALGMLLVSLLMLLVVHLIHSTGYLLQVSLLVFVIAWLGQFWGHHLEGKRPSFFDDVRFLLIGPIWVLIDLYQQLGITGYRRK